VKNTAATMALVKEIVEALLADGKASGYDLEAGIFGTQFSEIVRRLANGVTVEVDSNWCKYIAGLVVTYLDFNGPADRREEAIAGIIERRLKFLIPTAAMEKHIDKLDEAMKHIPYSHSASPALRELRTMLTGQKDT